MNSDLKEQVILHVLQFINGQALEKNKFEFKREWYNLSYKTNAEGHNKDYYEFLKDCTSLVNTYGGDDRFIVIGIDEDTKELFDSGIENSGRNASQIKDVIISNVKDSFPIDIEYLEVKGKNLAVIHIPPSTGKPHIIEEYVSKSGQKFQREIFTRNGSSSHLATKGDIDLMYWERGNIVLERNVKATLLLDQIHNGIEFKQTHLFLHLSVVLENRGLRPLSILSMQIQLNIPKETLGKANLPNHHENMKIVCPEHVLLFPGDIRNHLYTFEYHQFLMDREIERLRGLFITSARDNTAMQFTAVRLLLSDGTSLTTSLHAFDSIEESLN